MVCLGLEPKVAGWKVQINPLSYGSTLKEGSLLRLVSSLTRLDLTKKKLMG